MEKVKIGLGRLYNARACTIVNGEEFVCRLLFGSVEVLVTIGPNTRHIILTAKMGPPMSKDARSSKLTTRAREHEYPTPDIFPADVYLELVATQIIDVEDDLAKAFFSRDLKARRQIEKIGKEKKLLFTNALDYAAGLLGLRLHYVLVSIPIIEQSYSYRKKESPYAISTGFKLTVTPSYKLDIKHMTQDAIKKRLPRLVSDWNLNRASEILAWLLRAWAAEDPVLKFVALFTPLECVIPAMPDNDKAEEFRKRKSKLLTIIKVHADDEAKEILTSFINEQQILPASLSTRFENWASKATVPGWKADIAAFKRFSRIRNLLFHQGQAGIEFKVKVTPNDVRTLKEIAERYISLALFGDSEVYKNITSHA